MRPQAGKAAGIRKTNNDWSNTKMTKRKLYDPTYVAALRDAPADLGDEVDVNTVHSGSERRHAGTVPP